MIDAHLAAMAWYGALCIAVGFGVYLTGVAVGVRQERERREWEARRRAREIRNAREVSGDNYTRGGGR